MIGLRLLLGQTRPYLSVLMIDCIVVSLLIAANVSANPAVGDATHTGTEGLDYAYDGAEIATQ